LRLLDRLLRSSICPEAAGIAQRLIALALSGLAVAEDLGVGADARDATRSAVGERVVLLAGPAEAMDLEGVKQGLEPPQLLPAEGEASDSHRAER
jgi:hypothetical protein